MKPAALMNILVIAALLVAPHLLNSYWVDVLNSIGLYAILALSLNIILGYAGLFHMGHAAFFAMGTYTTAILNTQFGIPVLWLMPVSGIHEFYHLIFVFAAITVLLFLRLENSRFGRALNYIREDDVAAEGSGIDAARYKLVAFVLGAFWAGMAGTIFAAKMTIVSPQSFTFWESVVMFTIVILGGSGNIRGVLLGSFLIVGLPEIFREFAGARMLVFGAAMVTMMIFRPKGILPPLPRTYNKEFLSGLRGGGK